MRRNVARSVLSQKGQARASRRQTSGRLGTSLYAQMSRHKDIAFVCVVRRVGGIGDIVMILPSLKQLRRDFPSARITFAVDMRSTEKNVYYELVRNLSYIDRVMDARYVDKGKFHYTEDISSVCLRYERKDLPPINRIDLFSKALGVPYLSDKRPDLELGSSEIQWAKKFYDRYRKAGKSIVVLHTASMEEKRCWPIKNYVEIVTRAERSGLPVQFIVLDYNRRYRDWKSHSNVTEISNMRIRQLATLIGNADYFIGPDSGPMHLAGAAGTSSAVIFGSIPPEARINYYPTHRAIRLDGLSCLGCWYEKCPYNIKCMRELPSARVYNILRTRFEALPE